MREAHSAVATQLHFERLIAELSARFVNFSSEAVDQEIRAALKTICETLGFNRSTLVQLAGNGQDMMITHSWAAPGFPVAPRYSGKDLPWVFHTLRSGQRVQYSRLEELPEEAARDKEFFQHYGSRSLLAFPVLTEGKVIGAVSFASGDERPWPAELVERLRLVANIVGNALALKHTIQALHETQEQMQLAAESAHMGLWGRWLDSGEIWVSQQARILLSWRLDTKPTYDLLLRTIHPADRERVRRTHATAEDKPSSYRVDYRVVLTDGTERWVSSIGHSHSDGDGPPSRLTGVLFDITQQKHDEQVREDHLRFEGQLTALSKKFINLAPDQVDRELENGLGLLVDFMDVDRASLCALDGSAAQLVATHTYVRPGMPSSPTDVVSMPWLIHELENGNQVVVSRPGDLPPEAVAELEYLHSANVKSTLVAPLRVGSKTVAGISLTSLSKHCEWQPELLRRFELAAEVFANALERKRADQVLHQAYDEIKALQERLEKENVYYRQEIKLEHDHREIIGHTEALRRVLRKAEQVASTDSTVLLLGETGTGKELIARTIHAHSQRAARPMVKVNCATLPAALVESELFGRERGAYTGALTREIGRFELANDSTIFLDEIGELPLELQAKLLRVLQEGEFERLGSPRTIRVNVRVIAATSKDLASAVKDGTFREDLFYRLNVFPIVLPPLRERREDIPPLVWHFVRELSGRMGRNVESIRTSTMKACQNYAWPGNVRELRNVIERSLIISTSPELSLELPAASATAPPAGDTLEDIERLHIQSILQKTRWRIRGQDGAAAILGIKPTTLESRLKKLGIARA